MEGFPLCIIDTAGLGKAGNVVDQEGVKRAYSSMDQADIIFLMVDGSLPLTREDELIFRKTQGKNRLILVNKIDLPQSIDRQKMKALLPQDVITEISATRGTNLKKLKEVTSELILKEIVPSSSQPLLVNVRQKNVLEQAKKSILRALEATQEGMPEEVLVLDLKEGLSSLGEITGETTGEDILDRIFSNFCIGK
jgi:tRNA modification GTPase